MQLSKNLKRIRRRAKTVSLKSLKARDVAGHQVGHELGQAGPDGDYAHAAVQVRALLSGPETGERTRATRKADGKLTLLVNSGGVLA